MSSLQMVGAAAGTGQWEQSCDRGEQLGISVNVPVSEACLLLCSWAVAACDRA